MLFNIKKYKFEIPVILIKFSESAYIQTLKPFNPAKSYEYFGFQFYL
jgi:hypothetical protein